MSFGSGSIPGYLERLRRTKIRRANRQKEFKGGNDYSTVKKVKTDYNFPKISRYNLSELKKKLRTEAKKEQLKQIKIWFFAILIPVIIAFLIFNFY